MADLLIRNVDDETQRRLTQLAASNGTSVQAELLSILQRAVQTQPAGWVSMLRERAEAVDGMELEPPKRHFPRFTAIDMGDEHVRR